MAVYKQPTITPTHIFSTDLGKLPARQATNPPHQPLPAPVIARTNIQRDAAKFAANLLQQYPAQCRDIYAGARISDFWDPYDVHLLGATFLQQVLAILAQPNNQSVTAFAYTYARDHPNVIQQLFQFPITDQDALLDVVFNTFDARTITAYGPRMLAHVVHQLKWAQEEMYRRQNSTPMEDLAKAKRVPRSSQAQVDKHAGPLEEFGPAVVRIDPPVKIRGGLIASKGTRMGTIDAQLALNNPQEVVAQGEVKKMPNDAQGSNSSAAEMRRTVSAEQSTTNNMRGQRGRMERFAGRPSNNDLNPSMPHPAVVQGPLSVPPTPILPPPHSAGYIMPRQPSLQYQSGAMMSPQLASAISYNDGFGQGSRQSSRTHHLHSSGSVTTPYLNAAPLSREFSNAQLPHSSRAQHYQMAVEANAVPPALYAVPPGYSSQVVGQGPPMVAAFHPEYTSNVQMVPQPMHPNAMIWDSTNQQGYVPVGAYVGEPGQDRHGRPYHGETRMSGGKGSGRGQHLPLTSGGRNVSYQKPSGGRRFSIGSSHNRNRKGMQGSSNYSDNLHDGPYSHRPIEEKLEPGHEGFSRHHTASRMDEPFPEFGKPLEKRHSETARDDPEYGCNQSFIGSKRTDVKDLWVQGFPHSSEDFTIEKMLKKLFAPFGPIAVSVNRQAQPMWPVFAFINFNTTDDARKALSLNGDESLGPSLKVQVPEKHYDPDKVIQRRLSRGQPSGAYYSAGHRQPSGSYQYSQRSSGDGHGSFSETQPVYISHQHAQALGQNGPQSPYHPPQKRGSGHSLQSQGPGYGSTRQTAPSGANAQFLQRLDDHVFSKQDVRYDLVDRNAEVSASPEHKKKTRKGKPSPIKSSKEASEPMKEHVVSENENGEATGIKPNAFESALSPRNDTKQDELSIGEQGCVTTEADNDSGIGIAMVPTEPLAPLGESGSIAEADVDSLVVDGEATPSSPSTVRAMSPHPLEANSPDSVDTEGQKESISPLDSMHRTEDSFHSAVEVHTPSPTAPVSPGTFETPEAAIVKAAPLEVSCSTPANVARPPDQVLDTYDLQSKAEPEPEPEIRSGLESAEAALPIDSTSCTMEDSTVETPRGRDVTDVAKGPTTSTDPPEALTGKQPEKGATVAKLTSGIPSNPSTPAEAMSPSQPDKKAKIPKSPVPTTQPQAALHPFAKANQNKKQSKNKKAKKREKDAAKKTKKAGVEGTAAAESSAASADEQTDPQRNDSVTSSMVLTDEYAADVAVVETAREVVDVVKKGKDAAVPGVSGAKNTMNTLEPVSKPGKGEIVSTSSAATGGKKAKHGKTNSTQPATGPSAKLNEVGGSEPSRPASPEKKPKSTFAQRAAKLVAMPDLSMLKRREAK